MGTFNSDYAHMMGRDPEQGAIYRATGAGTAILANRLSWFFNLKGPSVSVDTGCSASLIALHLACQSILSGESDMGLVGGCNLILDPDTVMIMSDNGFLSPDGRSFSFDARANGYGRGEGSGVVVIKRLSDAIHDGDTIRAVIRATGSNHDGFTPGIAQPDFASQKDLIQETYRKAGLRMSETRYFEAHGTGTPVGDPIEARAIGEAFDGNITPDKPLIVTALKPNIGHLENVSGVASLIKTVLSLEKGVIPPIAGFEQLNPAIQNDAGLTFAKVATKWPTDGLRRASINSFGYGGANVHVVLDDAGHYLEKHGLDAKHSTKRTCRHRPSTKSGISSRSKLVVLSAGDENGIQRATSALEDYVLSQNPDEWPRIAADLSYTLSEKRSRLAWRSYLVLQPEQTLEAGILKDFAKPCQFSTPAKVAFVFTGQGAQWATMGQELLTYQVFRQSIEESGRYFQHLGSGWSLEKELAKSEDCSLVNNSNFAQPVNTALQIALVDLLRSWNVWPEATVGHSSGEIAAAYCVGSLTKEAALKVAYLRGIVAELAGQLLCKPAGMLAVGMSQAAAEQEIHQLFGDTAESSVSVACINSHKSVTLSGYVEYLERLSSELERGGVFARFVKTKTPYHSRFMDQVAPIYQSLLDGISPDANQQKAVPFFSSTTGGRAFAKHVSSPAYWVQNLLSPVQFLDSLSLMLQDSPKKEVRKLGAMTTNTDTSRITHIIEIGPHPALKGPIQDTLHAVNLDGKVTYSASLHREENSSVSLLRTAGDLFAIGYPIDLFAANNLKEVQRHVKMLTDLPGYDYSHSSRYWRESRLSKQYRTRDQGYHELLGTPAYDTSPQEARWRQYISLDEHPWVMDHEVLGVVVYPAAGLLVMALEAAKQLADEQKVVSRFGFEDVTIGKALVIPSDSAGIETQLNLRRRTETGNEHLISFDFTLRAFAGKNWFECCQGKVLVEYEAPVHEVETTTAKEEALQKQRLIHSHVSTELNRTAEPEDVYSHFLQLGLRYGPSFRAIEDVRCGESKRATAKLDALHWTAHVSNSNIQSHIIHPSTLDNILQLSMVALTRAGRDKIPAMVPTKISKLWIAPAISRELADPVLNLYAKACRTGFRGAAADFSALNSGEGLVMVEGFLELTSIEDTSADLETSLGLCYAVDWKPDLDIMAKSEVATYCRPQLNEDAFETQREWTWTLDAIKKQAIWHNSRFIVESDRYTGNREYLRKYVAFMGRKLEELDPKFIPCEDLQQYINSITEGPPSLNSELELTIRVAENLNSVLEGDTDPLALLFSDDLLTRFYSESVSTPSLYRGLENFTDLLGHKKPTLRILEIGAGTGGASRHLLEILAQNGDSSGYGPRFSHYCYTDISPSFFEAARSQFSHFADLIEYNVLDIEKDPAGQGFCADDFDIVLAANVVHATSNLDKTLSHINWLLKPGGNLILFEATQPDSSRTSFIFGLFPGWWLSSESDREHSPLLNEDGWDKQLKKSGFTGLDVAVLDDEIPFHQVIGLLISSKAEPAITHHLNDSHVAVIASRNSQLQQVLVERLKELLPEIGLDKIITIDFEDADWKIPPRATCIFLPELEQNCTWKMSETLLEQLKAVFASASVIFWLAGSTKGSSDPLTGIAVGLSRVYKSEHPELRFVHLEIEVARGFEAILNRLHQVLRRIPISSYSTFDDEYKEIDGVLHINRIVPDTGLDRIVRPDSFAKDAAQKVFRSPDGRQTTLTIAEPGLLESFKFVDNFRSLEPLAAEEVEIEIHATGLNFRDVLVALGQVDDDFFGFECAGKVRQKGSEVGHLVVGDRVVCLMQDTFATSGRCPAVAAVKLPESIPMGIGAGLPVVAATAYYALVHIGRLAAGESVLIHSGAGGLGQAAIQIAQMHNAVIYTTVGTTEKKNFLIEQYGIPSEHIFSSRTLAFANSLERLTNGRGVNVVLNSLSGEALRASWKCLAPFGRFLETGKKDILSSGQLPMDMFSKNVSFVGVDLAQIIKEQPSLTGRLLQEVIGLAEKKTISVPSPLHTFPASKIEEAFRFMQSGKSIGKIVIEFNDDDLVPTAPSKLPTWSFDPTAAYVIAGGLGGLGRSIVRWMASRGARNLIALSRRTHHGPEVRDLIQDLSQQGVVIATPSCDISSRDALKAALEQCLHLGPIKGCLQLSMVVREAEFQDMTLAAINESLRPKVDGSFNLHELLPLDLDFFIMFASISGIYGTPGTAPYAMGNVFQDELARLRTSQGLKATSIDLGIVTDVGYVAENGISSTLQKVGFLGLTDADMHAFLAHFCNPSLSVASPDRAQIIIGLDTLAATRARGGDGGPWYQRPLFSCINALRLTRGGRGSSGDGSETTTDVTATLRAAQTRDEAATAVLEGLIGKLVAILNLDRASVDTGRPLHAFGLDSLIGIEIRNWFRRFIGSDVAVFEILGNTSVADLAAIAAERSEFLKFTDE